MKKSFQFIALIAMVALGSCSSGADKAATVGKVEVKPKVKLASVGVRPVAQIQEYTYQRDPYPSSDSKDRS